MSAVLANRPLEQGSCSGLLARALLLLGLLGTGCTALVDQELASKAGSAGGSAGTDASGGSGGAQGGSAGASQGGSVSASQGGSTGASQGGSGGATSTGGGQTSTSTAECKAASDCSFPHTTAHCDKGLCVLGACDMGFFNCNGVTQDGCEIDLQHDAANCGKCAKVCSGEANECKDGHCK